MMNVLRGEHIPACLVRFALPIAAAVAISLIGASISCAQTYPSKPIKIVIPLTAGSPVDAMARLIAPALSARLGQPVIVENRPGGGGVIGTREVARAAPDGYTLLYVGLNHVFAPSTYKTVDYDPVKDFAPVGTVGTVSWVVVVPPSLPVTSVQELVAYARAHPGKLNWGFGVGTGPHLFGEMFMAATGIDVARISYKGGPQVIPDMLGGRIHLNFGVTANFLPLIQDGTLRALAVTSENRDRDLPDVPTMTESGFPRLTRGAWSGLLAPAATPSSIVNRLNAEINANLATPEMRASLMKLGFEPKPGSPADFVTLLADEIDAWTVAANSAPVISR